MSGCNGRDTAGKVWLQWSQERCPATPPREDLEVIQDITDACVCILFHKKDTMSQIASGLPLLPHKPGVVAYAVKSIIWI